MAGTDATGARRPSYAELEVLVGELQALVAEQQAQIADLRAQLDGNSRNSSRPPSSDGLSKPPVDPKKRSLRRRSGRRQGGQDGHEGARLEPVGTPDARVEHPPERCEGCGGDLADAEPLGGGEHRQVFDLPEGALLRVAEHVAERRRCRCGQVSSGSFPAGVGAPTQYGPGVRALGVYLCVFQHLSYDRAAQALADIAGAAVSTGTLTAWVTAAAEGLCDFDERLRELLTAAPVAHFDETGARIASRLGWVHSASTNMLTRYTAHARRGSEAIDAADVLPGFAGVAVHDGWAPYRNYPACEHGLCNVHHLRELQAATEAGHSWPLAMSCLLLDTKDAVAPARAVGAERLCCAVLDELAASFTTIIAMGHDEHPPVAAGKRSKAHNLLLRLECYEPDVLRFAHDFRVPFGNNQAEQDIRMVKLQQKISGCWRTTQGAERFLAVRSYISTARKHGLDALDALGALAAGQPWLPDAAPT
ncbi:MAG: IS66 family transposase [Actinobacteria bacterium]|nr:IS66 family transposase [Actinomycetota bacterium]MCA1700171.1 IS66 family transposase [Actinomycetota bacterium]